jgi:hypothetical protein
VDALALLAEAHAAGLEVHAEGDRLVVRGPKSAEALVLQLLDRKVEVMELLAPPAPAGPPIGTCRKCGEPSAPGLFWLCVGCAEALHPTAPAGAQP